MVFGVVAPIQRFLHEAFTQNLGLKLISLLISMLLFGLVWSQEEAEGLIDVPVVIKQPAGGGLVLTSDAPDVVRLRVRGPRSRIDAVREDNIQTVAMDLTDFSEGVQNFYFTAGQFQLPPWLEFVRVSPEAVPVRFERRVSRELPVRIRTTGRPKAGTELAEPPVALPGQITAFGANSVVRSLNAVDTEPVDVEGLAPGDHELEVALRHQTDLDLRGVNIVTVSVKVRWIPGQRLISGLLVRAEGVELAAEIMPKEVALALAGPQVALDRLDPATLIPVAVLSEEEAAKPGVHRARVEVRGIPEDISVKSVVPDTVRVELAPAPSR